MLFSKSLSVINSRKTIASQDFIKLLVHSIIYFKWSSNTDLMRSHRCMFVDSFKGFKHGSTNSNQGSVLQKKMLCFKALGGNCQLFKVSSV